MNPSIILTGVSKTFTVAHYPYQTIRERISHPWAPRTYTRLKAVRDVSLQINQGEFIGLIGRNGSGKSTLLKIIAGIYQPDRGIVQCSSKISPFLELGVGFHPDLTVRENIFLGGAVFGLARPAVRIVYEKVLAFSELGDSTDMKVRQLSTGMQMRLAFAMVVYVDNPIMLLDEALAVGDSAFQEKCLATLRRLHSAGRTIILVSHDIDRIVTLCDRLVYLDRGAIRAMGSPHEVAQNYRRDLHI